MINTFIKSGILTALTNLALHSITYFAFLKNFYATYPVGTKDYLKQLNRPADELVIWALLVSALAFGFFITTTIKWSGANTFTSGIKIWILIRPPLLDRNEFWSLLCTKYIFSAKRFCRSSL